MPGPAAAAAPPVEGGTLDTATAVLLFDSTSTSTPAGRNIPSFEVPITIGSKHAVNRSIRTAHRDVVPTRKENRNS